ncbi:MAG: transporter substrate-binding domain-containing protein [Paludibacteraceae bacterium]|nr:transporter substrate-binding domain-containing protein [Paludibacteraceae bacterium]
MEQKRKIILASGLILVLLLVGIIWISSKGGKLRDYKEINRKGVLRVATDYSSIDYYIKGDTAVGFQYELIQILCDSLHLKPEWVIENSLEKNVDDLLKGKVDIIARNIPITSELRKRVAFSSPIIQLPQVLVQRKAEFNNGTDPIRNQLLLAGKTVYVPKKSPNILRLRNLADEIADTIIVKEMPRYEAEQLMMMVAKGDIDYAVCDMQIAKQNALLMPELDVETAVSFTQMEAWAMRPSSPALETRINNFLKKFLQKKAYRDICRKYLNR